MIIHDFSQKFEYSLGQQQEFDINLLKDILVNCEDITKTPAEIDKAGIDYIATLRRGAKVNIDAKTREKGSSKYWRYGEPELALESYSVRPELTHPGKVGWTLNEASDVDYILYTFDRSDTEKFYFLPFQLLRLAYKNHFSEWNKKYISKPQYNKTWISEAVFVPASVVIEAINDLMQNEIRSN